MNEMTVKIVKTSGSRFSRNVEEQRRKAATDADSQSEVKAMGNCINGRAERRWPVERRDSAPKCKLDAIGASTLAAKLEFRSLVAKCNYLPSVRVAPQSIFHCFG
jgi:hypothetical protein